MNKSELIKSLSASMNSSETEASRFMESFEQIVRETLRSGGEITLVGFGKFHCKKQRARIGRNSKTGEPITIPSKLLPAFAPGKQLKEALHQPM